MSSSVQPGSKGPLEISESYRKKLEEQSRSRQRYRFFMMVFATINILLLLASLYLISQKTEGSTPRPFQWYSISVSMVAAALGFAVATVTGALSAKATRRKFRIKLGEDDFDVEAGERVRDIRRRLSEKLDSGTK